MAVTRLIEVRRYQALSTDALPDLPARYAGSTCWVYDGGYLVYFDGAAWRYAKNAPTGKANGEVVS
jgi:hypothetical protein